MNTLLRKALFISGNLETESTGGVIEHVNAETGKPQAEVLLAGPEDVDRAVASARAAFLEWREWSPAARREVLQRIAALIAENGDELARIGALEVGTPIRFTQARNAGVVAWFEYYAGWCDKLVGDTVPMGPASFDMTVLEPVGVVAKIITWNTPLSGIGMGIAPALAAGCCVIIKPSELAPFTCLRFAELCIEADLPPGVINVLPGTAEAGQRLVEHPGVDKISFTGGVATARKIQASAAKSLTPAVFELGGKSANIVFDDADLDRAVEYASLFTALAGQGCSLPTRLLVQENIHDEFVKRLVRRVESVVPGPLLDQSTEFGPVVNEASCSRILDALSSAASTGEVTVATGGSRIGGKLADGFYVQPTVLTDVAPGAAVAQQELFGPVLIVHRFGTEDEAIAIANGTPYGLAAYVHTKDVNRILRLSRKLEAGNIGVNGHGAPQAPPGPSAPFGGVKESGYGREGGREGIMEFIRVKNVMISPY